MRVLLKGRTALIAMALSVATLPGVSAAALAAADGQAMAGAAKVVVKPARSASLRYGAVGPRVSELQRRLVKLGYNTGGVDGKFGPKTRSAVLTFQRINKISVDGVVGPQTWRTFASSKRVTPAQLKRNRVASSKRVRFGKGHKGRLMAVLNKVKPKGLPLKLAAAVVTVESNWRVNARGSSGERGLMQLMPATARNFGARGNLYDPHVNMRVGTKYLHYCYKRAKRNIGATIGCYNRGPGLMWKWSGNPITRRYVAKVRRMVGRSA